MNATLAVLSVIERDAQSMEQALERIIAWEEPHEECDKQGCGHSDAGLGHLKCGCYYDSGIYLDHFCEHETPQSIARAALPAREKGTETDVSH